MMEVNLIKELNEPILKNQLIPLMSEGEKQTFTTGRKLPDISVIEGVAAALHVDPHDLYAIDRAFESYCYYRYPIFCEIEVFTMEAIGHLRVKERIELIAAKAHSLTDTNDWASILVVTKESAWALLLNDMYWKIPDASKYDLYKKVYTVLDYGVCTIDETIHRDVVSRIPKRQREKMLSRLSHWEQEGQITIYRGAGSGSMAVGEAMSWTLRLNVAAFFATRIRSDRQSTIYKAKVRKDKVTMLFTDRNEDEILVFPEDVERIEVVPQASLYEELESIQTEGYMDEYFLYKNTFLKPEHYHRPRGIHGVDHVKRVLFHAITLSRVLGLSSRDRAILANASLYHDVRRQHDGHCTEHGFWSWKWYHKYLASDRPLVEINCVDRRKRGETEGYDLEKLTVDDVKIVGFLVEYHCVDDDESEHALRSKHLHRAARERYWRLYQLFKECDGLDRVRLPLSEMDVRYFRTEEAVNRVSFAYHVFNQNAAL